MNYHTDQVAQLGEGDRFAIKIENRNESLPDSPVTKWLSITPDQLNRITDILDDRPETRDDDLILVDWYRQSVQMMTPQTIDVNRRGREAVLTLDRWSDGQQVSEREREDARACIAILDAEIPRRLKL